MADRKLTAKSYVKIDGKNVLWYDIDENGKVTWYLSKEESEKIKEKMLKNISEQMSRYAYAHPETILNDDE
ncbi:MAG: hypothetical protein ACI4HO_03875 [Ruminococcus sp.]